MKLEDVKKILDKVCKEENGWIKENETEDTNILYSKPLLSDSVSYDQKYITIEIIQEEDWEEDEENDIISFVISEIIISHPFFGEENPIIFNRDEDIIISLPKFLNILNKNLIDIKLEILKKYIEITEKFKSNYESILLDLGFISYRDSTLTENLFNSYGYNSSSIFKNKFEYIHKETSTILVFVYDYLTDDLYCFLNDSFDSISDIFLLTVEEFYISISTIMSKEQRLEYLFSSDPKYTKYTYNIINSLMDGITMLGEHNRFPRVSKNDLFRYDETDKEWYNHIPKKYEKLINKYESLKQKYYDDNDNNTSKDNH